MVILFFLPPPLAPFALSDHDKLFPRARDTTPLQETKRFLRDTHFPIAPTTLSYVEEKGSLLTNLLLGFGRKSYRTKPPPPFPRYEWTFQDVGDWISSLLAHLGQMTHPKTNPPSSLFFVGGRPQQVYRLFPKRYSRV